MTDSSAKYTNFVHKLFTTATLFEEHVLSVYNDDDRKEIMQILAHKLIRGQLKEELNFVHMSTLKTFKYVLINHLLFKEMASEWVSYAKENLDFTRENALVVLQDKKRVQYLVDLVDNYFRNYKVEFVKEICDTFIDLISVATVTTIRNKLIEDMIAKNIFSVESVSVVRDYYHVRIIAREALENKNREITELTREITDITFRLNSGMLSEEKRLEYPLHLAKLEKRLDNLEKKSLIYFSENLKKIRNLLFVYLMHVE